MSLELAPFQDGGYDRGRPWKEPDLGASLVACMHTCMCADWFPTEGRFVS